MSVVLINAISVPGECREAFEVIRQEGPAAA
jgi:hypothetical protein